MDLDLHADKEKGTMESESVASKDASAMNIRKAKELFRDYGREFVIELESVARVFRKARIRQPLPNGNFLHALCLTRVMLQHTNKSFLMVTGGAGGGFIDCLIDDFREMLGRIRNAKGAAKILVVNDGSDDEYLSGLSSEFPDCLEVAYAKSDSPIRHYIVADDDMLRDEQEHPPLSEDSDADSVVADVYFRNSNIASIFSERFERQWQAATARA
ncbi:MAG TPA: hypothetical protein VHY91_20985 [Pirellulales bacterium]|jgi:hypothetical protein|nr:hypothetical protein [Pirellulales bacterium]